MQPDLINILWTTDDRDVFLNMLSMYAYNAKKQAWFEEVNVIIWGPSARLTSEDKEVQTTLLRMLEAGVKVEACRACADIYGVSSKLESFGVDVKYMGEPLTNYLKNGEKILTI